MRLLRIYGSLLDLPQRCHWTVLENSREPESAEGTLAELPERATLTQLVIPAAQVLLVRTRVPQGARRGAGSALAYSVEDQTAGDPQSNQVSWLGMVGEEDVLAVVDKKGLARWRDALSAAGIGEYEVQCETLLLPWSADQWSLSWNGSEGFVRTGEFEGSATDCGDHTTPPLSLRLMLEEVQARSAGPSAMAILPSSPESAPDLPAWQAALGIALHLGGACNWRSAPQSAGVGLAQERPQWQFVRGMAGRLRPAAWMLGTALALHGAALAADWIFLESEQRTLRRQMETQFRSVFPEAVAVVDPVLQMRRKLADARHAAGQPDGGDFMPMIGIVVAAMKDLPGSRLRIVSYENGRLTLDLSGSDGAAIEQLVARLMLTGLKVEPMTTGANPGSTAMITVRAS